jgi:tripeptide aminopeptidase
MDLHRWVKNTLQIQSIPAPTFYEGARAQFMGSVFSSLNLLDIRIDEHHNVFARIPGESPLPLIVSAHLDTVFPLETPLKSIRKGNRIIGPGIGDNALGLAALVELAHDLIGSIPPNDIWLIANVGEEGLGNLLGMRKVVEQFGADVLAYLVLEGMALGHVYHQGLPIHRYRISASTIGGHAWIHAGRASAIHLISQIGAKLAKISLPDEPRWSLNIGRIGGGTSINTIAPEAWMELDLRGENQETLEVLDTKVLAAIETIAEAEVNISLEQIGHRPAGAIPPDHPLVVAACQALEEVGIRNYRLEAGSTDASVPLSQDLPAICIGLTFGSGAHSLEEHIEIQPLTQGYRALRKTMEACFTLRDEDELA